VTRLRRLVSCERGYTMIELLQVTVILGVVMAGLTVLFIQASNAELQMNRRFQAQQAARVAIDRMRRDLQCASLVTPAGASNSFDATLPSQCPGGGGVIRWCMHGGTKMLYRKKGPTGGACGPGDNGQRYVVYVTNPNPFTYTAPTQTSLGTLRAELHVNPEPSVPQNTWKLVADMVLRNTSRLP
jgi:prepilin-type N-terminal cleavage/methylation domain-containing protein